MPRKSVLLTVAGKELKRRERRAAVWGFIGGCVFTLFALFVIVQLRG
jgi:predicted tellurium resistance membrane protein TerC